MFSNVQVRKGIHHGRDYSFNSVQFPLPQKNVQDPWNFIFSPDTVKKVAIKDLKCIKGFNAFKLGLRNLYPYPLTHNWSPDHISHGTRRAISVH